MCAYTAYVHVHVCVCVCVCACVSMMLCSVCVCVEDFATEVSFGTAHNTVVYVMESFTLWNAICLKSL